MYIQLQMQLCKWMWIRKGFCMLNNDSVLGIARVIMYLNFSYIQI